MAEPPLRDAVRKGREWIIRSKRFRLQSHRAWTIILPLSLHLGLLKLHPQRRRTGRFFDDRQACMMLGKLCLTGLDHSRAAAFGWQATNCRRLLPAVAVTFLAVPGQRKIGLATGHGQVDVSENLRIE